MCRNIFTAQPVHFCILFWNWIKGESSCFCIQLQYSQITDASVYLQLSSYNSLWITGLECKPCPDKYWLLVALKWDQVKSWPTLLLLWYFYFCHLANVCLSNTKGLHRVSVILVQSKYVIALTFSIWNAFFPRGWISKIERLIEQDTTLSF